MGEDDRVHAQPGIFSPGTTEHCCLELDLAGGRQPEDLVAALAALSGAYYLCPPVEALAGFVPEG